MAVQDVTKPIAKDETLQATNAKLDVLAKDLTVQALNTTLGAVVTALGLLGTDSTLSNKLQAIADAILNSSIMGDTDISQIADGTVTGAIAQFDSDISDLKSDMSDLDSAKADKVDSATNGNLAGLNATGNPTDSGISGDMTTNSATGNPISIADLKSAQIALNPVITFEPIQAGSGAPSPSNIRAISGYDKIEVLSTNRNIWGEDWEVGAIDNSTGQNNNSDLTQIRVKGYILIAPNTTYAFSCPNTSIRIYWYDIDKTFISSGAILNSTAVSPSNAHYLRIRSTGSYGNTYKNDIMVTCGNDASVAYEPSVKTTDLSESLGQTVYGGSLDVRTGKLVSKQPKKIKANSLSWTYESTNNRFYSNDIADADKSGQYTIAELICSHIPTNNEPLTASGDGICLYSNGKIYLRVSGITDVTTFINTYGDADICYTVATPTEIQLTPHEIALSQGYNYISTNGTSISLAYHNGELATHADVEQLAETVNDAIDYMKEYVEANYRGGNIDISGYSGSNKYTIPNDGYINVDSTSNTSGYARVVVQDVDGHNLAFCYMNVTAAYQIQSVFVRKGMLAYVQANTSNASITYVPLQ